MKRKVFVALVAVLLATTLTWAQRGPQKNRGFDRPNRPDISERLDLTEEQQTQIEALRTAHFKSTQELRDQLKEKEVKLDALLNDEEINSKEVERLVSEIGKNRTTLMQSRVNHRIEIRKLLTGEQKIKFDMTGPHMRAGHVCRYW